MKSSRFRFILLGASVVLSIFLLADVSRKNLYGADPSTGRIFGCYSDLEILLGLKSPSGWIPPAEAAVGIVLLLGALIAGGLFHSWSVTEKRRRADPEATPLPSSDSMVSSSLNMAALFKRVGLSARRAWLI